MLYRHLLERATGNKHTADRRRLEERHVLRADYFRVRKCGSLSSFLCPYNSIRFFKVLSNNNDICGRREKNK